MRPSPPLRPKPSQRPRYRYLLTEFQPAGLARGDVIRRLREALPPELTPWLTRYDGRYGILRVLRGEETRARAALSSLAGGFRATPLSTSGTIAALERRHRLALRDHE